ncbi:hypothetical protein AB0D22_07030 [Kitasatospora sp. NPDC048538]|uniref:hypothetical protein n=1 Tax=Kitasatospora sp. NPDC048538 TaxID=3155633 RepID=UPI0033F19E06
MLSPSGHGSGWQRACAKGFPFREGVTENGIHKEYLIEGAREGDVIVRSVATPALLHLAELLNVNI